MRILLVYAIWVYIDYAVWGWWWWACLLGFGTRSFKQKHIKRLVPTDNDVRIYCRGERWCQAWISSASVLDVCQTELQFACTSVFCILWRCDGMHIRLSWIQDLSVFWFLAKMVCCNIYQWRSLYRRPLEYICILWLHSQRKEFLN